MPFDDLQSICFDVDNTLVDRSHAVKCYIHELINRFPRLLAYGEKPSIVEMIAEKDNHGYLDRSEFCQWMSRKFSVLEMSPEAVWMDFSRHLKQHFYPDPEIVKLLKGLENRYPLYIITNGSKETQLAKLKRSGIDHFFKGIFISGEVGASKPNPKIFKMALSKANCKPRQAIYVGDDPINDIWGAARIGMKTCWVTLGRPLSLLRTKPNFYIKTLHHFKDEIE